MPKIAMFGKSLTQHMCETLAIIKLCAFANIKIKIYDQLNTIRKCHILDLYVMSYGLLNTFKKN